MLDSVDICQAEPNMRWICEAIIVFQGWRVCDVKLVVVCVFWHCHTSVATKIVVFQKSPPRQSQRPFTCACAKKSKKGHHLAIDSFTLWHCQTWVTICSFFMLATLINSLFIFGQHDCHSANISILFVQFSSLSQLCRIGDAVRNSEQFFIAWEVSIVTMFTNSGNMNNTFIDKIMSCGSHVQRRHLKPKPCIWSWWQHCSRSVGKTRCWVLWLQQVENHCRSGCHEERNSRPMSATLFFNESSWVDKDAFCWR